MVTRFLHARIKPGKLSEMKRYYNEEVLPTLQKTPGCLFACLIQSVNDPEELISFTLWNTLRNAQAYEETGAYRSLLEGAGNFLQSSTEWRVQLTKELKLEYTAVQEEPLVRSYKAVTRTEAGELAEVLSGPMYVRLTSVKVEQEKTEDFKRIYDGEILPQLRTVAGCRYAFLVESPEEGEVISVTIWDSKEHADAYEQSGMFDRLVEKVRHTFSHVYQWKMKLAEEAHAATVTSEDLTVKPYQVVTGKQLRSTFS